MTFNIFEMAFDISIYTYWLLRWLGLQCLLCQSDCENRDNYLTALG